ncbi:hypothetical protein HYN46_14295 [Aquirhabdus parva]|uniref:Uncharacterized protein n=1 Tax=Aquirhabdus parva TaxID=2283318 RepID=A0A345P9E8_9GAMM|nr:hypothetical protein HYN46_14295 [Aquirhabdus parva]
MQVFLGFYKGVFYVIYLINIKIYFVTLLILIITDLIYITGLYLILRNLHLISIKRQCILHNGVIGQVG